MDLADRVAALRARIDGACAASGRDPAEVELLPVSKRQPLELIREAAELGFRRFGENYVQEGDAKAREAPELDFLLIGPLQRNKARQALRAFREIQSLDRPDLAERLRHIAAEEGLARPVWIQVDLWDEQTKAGGCAEADLPDLLAALDGDPALPLRGFMAIPPPEHPSAFTQLAALREAWRQRLGQPLRLSMGMTADLEEAIAAGSDQIRVGTAFFGMRSI